MLDVQTLLLAIPALPLAATLGTAAFGKWVLRDRSHWPLVVALTGALVASCLLVWQVGRECWQAGPGQKQFGYEKITLPVWRWATVGNAHHAPVPSGPLPSPGPRDFRVEVVLRADPLTAVMLATVTLISLLVAIYSIGYMHGDPGYWRFYTYIGLFVFSMTMLVSVANFVLLYVFWEAVGFCSYILIGFWFERPAAAAAGKKAFLVNRVGDFGFALGVFLIWTTFGTVEFREVLERAGSAGHSAATAICLLLLLGACGKSAQLPLHVWLPDAMEGPTPVSALIHAATMVTAGVYLIARCGPLFAASPEAQLAVALVGGLTALVAAVTAMTQTDLKRILAYSTISQLGYMFLGLGTGTVLGVAAGMFHLVTHAFFKALLFLGAGSVMHAMGGVIDIQRFGGLRRRLPVTHATFLVGSLGLAGLVPLAGFWSKDAILLAVRQRAGEGPLAAVYQGLFALGLLSAVLTAFYTFRAFFVTFYGPEKIPDQAGGHAHEAPRSMGIPLVILAIGTVGVGVLLETRHLLAGFLEWTPSLVLLRAHGAEPGWGAKLAVGGLSTILVAAGMALAWLLYLAAPRYRDQAARAMQTTGLYSLSAGKFYFDQTYQLLVVCPLERFARLCAWADHFLVDGLVDLIGLVPAGLGFMLRSLQGGLIPFYALAMVLGLLVLLGALFM
ncbi:MAG: NADH-quinone oxidoreductase subunit L [Thermoguttaceae bacterium]